MQNLLRRPKANLPSCHIYAAYRPLFFFLTCMLVLLSTARLGLVTWLWPRVQAEHGLWFILLQGVRFDLIALCAALLFPAVLSPWFCHRRGWNLGLCWYLSLMATMIVFMELVTPPFILEYDQRPNILFVEYLKYPQEVARMLWVGYKVEIATCIGGAILFFLWFRRALTRRLVSTSRVGVLPAIAVSILALVLCAAGIRSSFGHRPANPSKVAFSQDLLVNDLALSSLYSAAYAVYASGRHESDIKSYGRMDRAEVFREVRSAMALPASAFLSDDIPTLHTPLWVEQRDRPLNLVIVGY